MNSTHLVLNFLSPDVHFYRYLSNLVVEIFMFRVYHGTKIIKKPLERISFPKGAILGGIIKNNIALLPDSDTTIFVDDLVIVISTPSAEKSVKKLFIE